MYGEVITVGRELLMGEIVDTNAGFLAQKLAEAGVNVRWVSQVGDDIDHLSEAFARALGRSDITVSSGGLGPTSDDLTREAVAAAVGESPKVDPETLSWLRGVFERRGTTMPDTNIKQATLIPSAETIPNPNGTAPGWWVQTRGKHVALLPGPPRELATMWADYAGPKVATLSGAGVVFTRTLKTAGMTEGGIDEILSDLFGSENPYLGIYARRDGIQLRIIARADSDEGARNLAAPLEAEIRQRLKGAIWGADDETAGSRICDLLASEGRTFAVLEGASGGAVASMMAAVKQNGKTFRGSMVAGPGGSPLLTPLLEALLGWPQARLMGGMGVEAAVSMAKAARQLFGSDVGLGITPMAIDDGVYPDGTVWVAVVSEDGEIRATSRFTQHREVAMQRAGLFALVELATALGAGLV